MPNWAIGVIVAAAGLIMAFVINIWRGGVASGKLASQIDSLEKGLVSYNTQMQASISSVVDQVKSLAGKVDGLVLVSTRVPMLEDKIEVLENDMQAIEQKLHDVQIAMTKLPTMEREIDNFRKLAHDLRNDMHKIQLQLWRRGTPPTDAATGDKDG